MSGLKEIRNRISSVSSTMQITNAMKMVSAAKLKKAQDSISATLPYSNKLSELIKNIRKGGTLIVPNDMNYLQRWKNMAKGINVIPVPKKFIAKNEKISKDKKVMTFDIIKSCNDDKKSKAISISSSLL